MFEAAAQQFETLADMRQQRASQSMNTSAAGGKGKRRGVEREKQERPENQESSAGLGEEAAGAKKGGATKGGANTGGAKKGGAAETIISSQEEQERQTNKSQGIAHLGDLLQESGLDTAGLDKVVKWDLPNRRETRQQSLTRWCNRKTFRRAGQLREHWLNTPRGKAKERQKRIQKEYIKKTVRSNARIKKRLKHDPFLSDDDDPRDWLAGDWLAGEGHAC
eukprot:CAMPEP_0172749110 /NCGR_PEP_ID=MMETSP1074-20121228/146541_1 /TAXON_ID=2916 /ORGANISM="Ceratium fusus, Strain PA161109" /LENGTH=220 /DNA_ID=CAMNT_0013580985 /DNA_START=255 /DNA_END=917 /DNA_ORIENTATION=-